MNFTTKAGTLESLQKIIKSAIVPPLIYFKVSEWKSKRSLCIDKLIKDLGEPPWIVRSSCSKEDNNDSSHAGEFLSIPNVQLDSVETAIDKVIDAYGDYDCRDEVLIQPMLKNVVRSGVVFSHDPNNSAPYRIVNWSEGDDTSAVTGGLGGKVWQQAARSPKAIPKKHKPIITLVNELLNIFNDTPIDCEFAFTKEKNS